MNDSHDPDPAALHRMADVLAVWASRDPQALALVQLDEAGSEVERISRGALHQRAAMLARALRDQGLVGQRALLAFHSSVDYVVALLGCLYAGVVAVPVYPPRQNWHAVRLQAVAADAGTVAVLASDAQCADVQQRLAGHSGSLQVHGVQALVAGLPAGSEGWLNDEVQPHHLAYLQYTSGSTGDPKGVMVSHANLAANTRYFAEACNLTPGCGAFVSWLPIHHDMGLVAGIMLPLSLGETAVFMPPAAFLQQPLLWLRALSDWRAVFSAAPNFAYDLCASRIQPEQAAELDLSNWRVAINGAEPIRGDTIDAFCARFAVSGLRPGTLCGGFGMAEATLAVTMCRPGEPSPRLWLDRAALGRNRVLPLPTGHADGVGFVSSGCVRPQADVRIVRPHDLSPGEAGDIGEIWVHGPSVGGGYWNRREVSEETFGARLAGEDPGRRWLRTGDLGFVHEGQLYVSGRLKDLVIVRGVNHYPQDLERCAETAHPALRVGGYGAAFMTEAVDGEPQVVLVQEVERTARRSVNVAEAGRAMADAVAREHGIALDLVVLVPPTAVPKTSSGKVQRRACRQALVAGELPELGRWVRPASAPAATAAVPLPAQAPGVDLLHWLRQRVAALTCRALHEIPQHTAFSDLGVDSARLVELVAELGALLQRPLPASLLFDHPTVEALARHLQGASLAPQADRAAGAVAVAIVGMDCRLPGADGVQAYWELLDQGRSAIATVPAGRAALTGWRADAVDATARVGLLADVEGFDAAFFGIAPREAQVMDPQQRLLLETTWHALEGAGIAPDSLEGTPTGVWMGISSNDYYRLQRGQGAGLDSHAGTGGALSIAANRISYCLGLQGPSLAVDTACSSSLVAIHLACRSLALGETDLALAGGVNLVLTEDLSRVFARAGMLAPDGQCKTFDAAANGYVRGEGCGVLVLKRLDDAQRAGDPVLAVIAGSAVNQDGRSNGLTAPNGLAQQRVVRAALRAAGVEPAAIDCVETHGTGTPLGDPIEVHALRAVLDTPGGAGDGNPCWLGAVKTQIGHLEAAAGVAGVIKTVLALGHERWPGNLNFRQLNPQILLAGSRLQPAAQARPWPARPQQPRHAGVSSFGFGGTNAHLVLREAPSMPAAAAGPSDRPLGAWLHTLSADTPQALRKLALQHAQALQAAGAQGEPAQLGLVQRANTGRAARRHRLACAALDAPTLVQALQAWSQGADIPTAARLSVGDSDGPPVLAFLFTGQGSHHAGMGAGLYEHDAAFRAELARCDAILRPQLGVSLPDLLFGPEAARMGSTRYAQPATVAFELALVAFWAAHGVRPDLVCGHSVGEYAAAVVCGVMDLDTALNLVVLRARLMDDAPGHGAMLSVAAEPARLLHALGSLAGVLDVAAFNDARQTVISGDSRLIDEAAVLLQGRGLLATRLNVSHAFHSSLMVPATQAFAPMAAAARLKAAHMPMVTTGGSADADVTTGTYWAEQIRRPVCFVDALHKLHDRGVRACIEIGPGHTLLSLARGQIPAVARIASLERTDGDLLSSRAALGAWWSAGGRPRLASLYPWADASRAAALPTYPFERRPHWFQAAPTASSGAPAAWPGQRLALAHDALVAFETRLPAAVPWAADHVVAGQPLMPAAAWVALALRAAMALQDRAAGDRLPPVLARLSFDRPLRLDAEARVQTVASRQEAGWRVAISSDDGTHGSADPARWQTCMRCEAWPADGTGPGGADTPPQPLADAASLAREGTAATLDTEDFYRRLRDIGLDYGPSFRGLRDLRRRRGLAWARVDAPPPPVDGLLLDAPWLDAVFQSVGALLLDELHDADRVPVPVAMDRLALQGAAPAGPCDVVARIVARRDGEVITDLQVGAAGAPPWLRIEGLALRWVARLSLTQAAARATARTDLRASGASSASSASAASAAQPLTGLEQDRAPAALPVYALSASALPQARPDAEARWLLAAATGAAAFMLADRLAAAGVQAQAVDAGLDSPAALVRAWQDARGRDARTGLLLAVSLPAAGDAPGEAAAMQAVLLAQRLQALLLACDALAAGGPRAGVCLLTLQQPAADAPGAANAATADGPAWPAPSVAVAAAAALWRSAALELPGLMLRHAALPTEPTAADLRALAGALAGDETEWRVQDGQAWAPRLRPLELDASATAGDPPSAVADGAVLITGGTGAVGLHIAGWLVAQGVRHLCLAARRPLTDFERLTRIAEWRERGCRVDLVSCDVGRREDLVGLLRGLRDQGTVLRGLVLAAGLSDDGALFRLDAARWQAMAASKPLSTAWLAEVLDGTAPAFVIACSSAAAALGAAGQAHYGAANAMQESLLQAGPWGRQRPTLLLQWGPWAGPGMADRDAVRAALSARGIRLHTPGEALATLDAVSRRRDQVPLLVGHFDWQRLAATTPAPVPSALRAVLGAAAPVGIEGTRSEARPRPDLAALTAMDKPQALDAIRSELRTQVMQVLGVDADALGGGVAARFDGLRLSTLGLDSLMATELRNRVRDWLGVDLPAHLLIGNTNAGELIQTVHDKAVTHSLGLSLTAVTGATDDTMEVELL